MAGTARMFTSTILPIIWRTALMVGDTTTCELCSRPANGTCAGRRTRSLRRFCARAEFGTSCMFGATKAITIGLGGDRWQGFIWSKCFSQLTTDYWQLATGNWQLATGNWQLATGNWLRPPLRGST